MATRPPRWVGDVTVPLHGYESRSLRNNAFLSDAVDRSGRVKGKTTLREGATNEEKGVTMLTLAAIVAAAVGAIIVLSIAFMRKYRTEKQSALVLARKSAEANAIRINAITSPTHAAANHQTTTQSDFHIVEGEDRRADSNDSSNRLAEPPVVRKDSRRANATICVVWIISPADMMSHSRGEDGPYFDRHVKAMRLLFANAYNAPRVRLLVWLYDVHTTPKSSGAAEASSTVVNASVQADSCRLMRRYKLECAAHRDLHYSGNITIRHKPKSEWYGLYVAQYEALAHLSTTVASINADQESTFMMYSSASHWMVKHWDQSIIDEWYSANGACSGQRDRCEQVPVLTCRPPTIKQAEAALLEIETERMRAVANNEAQQGNGLPYDSAWLGQSREDKTSEADRQKLQQYRTNYQFAIDCGSFLPGTWSTFDHWCAIDCDLRLKTPSPPWAPSSSQKRDASFLKPVPPLSTEHNSKWQIFLPVANNISANTQPSLFFQKVVIESDGNNSVPIATGWYQSAFAFSTLKTFIDVPSDPRWIGFSPADGLDFLQSVRMWSHGCRFFHPTKTMCIDSSPPSSSSSSGPIRKTSRVLCIPKFSYANLYRYVYAVCNQGNMLTDPIILTGTAVSKQLPTGGHVGTWRMFGDDVKMIDAFYSALGVFPSTGHVSIDAVLGLFQEDHQTARNQDVPVYLNSKREYCTMVKYGSWQRLHDAVNNLHATNHVALKHTFSPYRTSSDRLIPADNDDPFHAFMQRAFLSHIIADTSSFISPS